MIKAKNAAKVRSLYRRFLRTARTWPDHTEKMYILETTRREFRDFNIESNVGNSDPDKQVANAILEGENRLAMALHYGSPYERINHLGGGGAEGITHYKENAKIAKGRKKINMSGHSKWFDGNRSRCALLLHRD